MILSDQTITGLLADGTLKISPMERRQIQPASVDIRLGDTFGLVEDSGGGILRMQHEISYKTLQTDTYLLLPGQFVLATTMEYVALPDDLTAFVEGRSSLGRLGLFIQNAGWVDPGFEGEITLEQGKVLNEELKPTAAPSNCAPGAGSGSSYSRGWTAQRRILTRANTKDSGARPAPVRSWTRSSKRRADFNIRKDRATWNGRIAAPQKSYAQGNIASVPEIRIGWKTGVNQRVFTRSETFGFRA